MKNLLCVTIDNSPKILNYIVDKDIKIGEKVVVESERGITVADVKKTVAINENENLPKHPNIIRIATNKDLLFQEMKKELEEEAKKYCLERIEYRNMKMKIVDVKYMLHSSKVIFYFTAEGRVDFRALVKDLASKLKSRIEMRQIGVRDQAQMVGGIGVCGRELCCYTFMNNFLPVSLDDAKQNASGNSDKLIGVCGRFMCCLKFEENDDCKNCDKNPQNSNEDKKVENQYEDLPISKILEEVTNPLPKNINHTPQKQSSFSSSLKEISKPTTTSTNDIHKNDSKNYHYKKKNDNADNNKFRRNNKCYW